MWARQARGKDGSRPGIKESVRRVEGYECLAEMALQLPDGKGCFVQASCNVAKEMQPAAGDKRVEWRCWPICRRAA
ncbi:hypothetical protein [Polaromonas sp.]|uniref:hypothetical protein n=1 Tax=Polaromonas sp. TaxID=1869339 RepID=UPI0034206EF8